MAVGLAGSSRAGKSVARFTARKIAASAILSASKQNICNLKIKVETKCQVDLLANLRLKKQDRKGKVVKKKNSKMK